MPARKKKKEIIFLELGIMKACQTANRSWRSDGAQQRNPWTPHSAGRTGKPPLSMTLRFFMSSYFGFQTLHTCNRKRFTGKANRLLYSSSSNQLYILFTYTRAIKKRAFKLETNPGVYKYNKSDFM